jgi:thiol-disulfide isomerase/thioredoxin
MRARVPEPLRAVALVFAALIAFAVHSTASAAAADIQWFNGSVDAAFAQAKRDHKPVFLYWGAVWCPPCLELKATVFAQPAFVQKSRLFVPVYLDGDSEAGQRAGAAFGVTGYPTVVILSPERREVLRLSGGLDLRQYEAALDVVLQDVVPVAHVLATIESSGNATLSLNECRRLAYNNWFDADRALPETASLATSLERAGARCPETALVERARLAVGAAFLQATPARVASVGVVLGDVAAVRGSLELFDSLGKAFFDVAKAERAHAALLEAWSRAMDSIASDPTSRASVVLDAIGAKLEALRSLSDGAIPQPVADAAYRSVTTALRREYSLYERAGVVNSASHVLDRLERKQELYAILEDELKRSHTPYYYMVDLATLDEELGNEERALSWFHRAYEASSGPATRFQWGVMYVQGLLRMTPEDATTIRHEALRVLTELDGPDRIYARTKSSLAKLGKSFDEWNKDGKHNDVIEALRTRMDTICVKIPAGEPAAKSCLSFLARV